MNINRTINEYYITIFCFISTEEIVKYVHVK